jgi:hypothetical protein
MFQKDSHARTGEQSIQESEKWLAQEREKHLTVEVEDLLARDVEQRLSAYYGPALPPHPLPADAWLRLKDQLRPHRRTRRSCFSLAERVCSPSRQRVPVELQHIYATLLLQINYRHASPGLRVHFRARAIQPRVRASGIGRGQIGLVLPRENWRTFQKAELDVLLAAGLARASRAGHPLMYFPRALFGVSLLLVLAALPFTSLDRRALWIFLAAVVCCLVSGRVLLWQQRALAFRCDRVAVQWLGRERVCQGLHLLAERGHARRRPTWGEPSLVERIERVCGTPTAPQDKRLTLVG